METVCQNMRDLLKKIETSPTLKEADRENEKLMVKIKFSFLTFFHLTIFDIILPCATTYFCNNHLCVGDSVTQLR